MADTAVTLGARLKAWRLRQDNGGKPLSQSEAARRLGHFTEDGSPVAQATWAAWERDEKRPDICLAFALQRMTTGEIQAEWWGKRRQLPRTGTED